MDSGSGYVSIDYIPPTRDIMSEHKENWNPTTRSLQTQPIKIPRPPLGDKTNRR